jgi:hypothetical protein
MLRHLFVLHKASRLCVELCAVFLCFSSVAPDRLREFFVDLSSQMIQLKHVLKEVWLEVYETEHELSSRLGVRKEVREVPLKDVQVLNHVHVTNLETCVGACLRLWEHVCALLPEVAESRNHGYLLNLNDSELRELSALTLEDLLSLQKDLDVVHEEASSCCVFIK